MTTAPPVTGRTPSQMLSEVDFKFVTVSLPSAGLIALSRKEISSEFAAVLAKPAVVYVKVIPSIENTSPAVISSTVVVEPLM